MRIIKGRGRRLRRCSVALALLALLMLLAAPVALADPFVTQDLSSTLTANDLAQALAGSGVTISNVVYTGAPLAAGTFTGGSGIIDFDSGVALSSGYVSGVLGPNDSSSMSGANDTLGDADLAVLAGEDTYDAAILDFDFVPTSDKVTFQYVFGSEEYNEYVNSQYNDVFAFYVNGVNYATVGSPAVPVSVDTINNGNPYGSTPNSHPELYLNNEYFWDTGDPMPSGARDTQLDGLTKTLIFEAPVVKNQTNHMRLAIADAGDEILDSDVFIKAGSFAVENPPLVAVTASPGAVNEGQTASAAGTWSDPDGDAVSLSASVGSVTRNAGGTWSWSYATSDGPVQSQTVTITANDGRGGTSNTQFALSVANVAPAVTAGTDKTITVGETFTGSGSFIDPGADAAWTATVDYGDGSGSAALALNADKTFGLSHACNAVGAFTITVKVTDKDGAQGSATVHVVVQAAVNRAPLVAVTASPGAVNEGQTASAAGTWSDPDGDAVSLSASVGSVTRNAGGTWSWSYATSDGPVQSQTVTITANDGRGGTSNTQFALSVANVAPAVTAGTDKTITVGETFTGSGSFTDPGADAAWTATVDYGDGSGSAALALNADKTFSLSHACNAVGAFTITVKVTDKDGAQGSATVHVVVQAANQARPHLIRLSPMRGRRGTIVTIIGTNLGARRGTSVVKFGAKACTKCLSWTATKIRCKVPARAKFGKVPVIVITGGGASNALRFKVRR